MSWRGRRGGYGADDAIDLLQPSHYRRLSHIMNKKDLLQQRLNDIGHSVSKAGGGLAVIGLGSAGREGHRLDDFSDLDFFVIVEDGFKARYLDHLDWLSALAPIAFQFRNTADGYKVLFADHVFCEFAVFEWPELRSIPFAPGRVIWKRPPVDDSIAQPVHRPAPPGDHTTEWLLGEALTNLYVGLCRYQRGEKLSAARFVQQFAVDRLVELVQQKTPQAPGDADPFSPERRLELRYPGLASRLPEFVQGYDRTPESAEAILNFLCSAYAVNEYLATAIRSLCKPRRN